MNQYNVVVVGRLWVAILYLLLGRFLGLWVYRLLRHSSLLRCSTSSQCWRRSFTTQRNVLVLRSKHSSWSSPGNRCACIYDFVIEYYNSCCVRHVHVQYIPIAFLFTHTLFIFHVYFSVNHSFRRKLYTNISCY